MEINRENLRQINIKELALKKEFGAFAFENANKKLEKIRNWILELEALDYKNELPENIVNNINNLIEEFLGHLKWLQAFDITTSGNAKQDHDSFESRIDGFYNNFVNLILTSLTYLRQEASLKSKDKKQIQKEQKELIQVRKQYDSIISQLSEELNKLRKEKNKIESTRGEIGATKFGKHFEYQASEYEKATVKWLKARDNWFSWLLKIIIANLVVYFYLFVANKLKWWPNFPPKEFFTLEYGLVKLALISLLSYAISFSSRNYNVNSNLVALNKHRKNVAETVDDFLASGIDKEYRSKIIDQGTEAMFKHLPIGYLPKMESKDEGPVSSLITTALKPFK